MSLLLANLSSLRFGSGFLDFSPPNLLVCGATDSIYVSVISA
jgi:hypothetical protein